MSKITTKMDIVRSLKRLYWNFRASNLRGMYLACRYRGFRFPTIVRGHFRSHNLKYMTAGRHLVIADHVEIFINPGRGCKAQLRLGDNVSIGRFSIIGCSNEIVLEDDVTLAPHVHLTDRNHSYEDISTPIWRQPAYSPGPIIIGRHSWLGFGVQVMPGVRIGRHCVIAAGSIVTKDVPDYSVAAGVPAKVVKRYNSDTGKWQ